MILELGGGATALCGLGLAVAGVGKEVILTDGHPDCVRNQVYLCMLLLCNVCIAGYMYCNESAAY